MKKHPPLDLLVRMGRSDLNLIASIACLTAALGVQRGDFTSPKLQTIDGEPLTPEFERAVLATVDRAREEFLTSTPEELQAAIDLYVAHLNFLGFNCEWGVTN